MDSSSVRVCAVTTSSVRVCVVTTSSVRVCAVTTSSVRVCAVTTSSVRVCAVTTPRSVGFVASGSLYVIWQCQKTFTCMHPSRNSGHTLRSYETRRSPTRNDKSLVPSGRVSKLSCKVVE